MPESFFFELAKGSHLSPKAGNVLLPFHTVWSSFSAHVGFTVTFDGFTRICHRNWYQRSSNTNEQGSESASTAACAFNSQLTVLWCEEEDWWAETVVVEEDAAALWAASRLSSTVSSATHSMSGRLLTLESIHGTFGRFGSYLAFNLFSPPLLHPVILHFIILHSWHHLLNMVLFVLLCLFAAL